MRVLLLGLFMCYSTIFAKDFGRQGHVFEIREERFSEMIQRKLSRLDLNKERIEFQQKLWDMVNEPKSLGLRRARKERDYEIDLSYVVKENIEDLNGKMIAYRGQKINPFDYITLDKEIVFINSNDQQQLAWLEANYKDKNCCLILTEGRPIEISAKLNRQVYFDQFGTLSKRFKITAVPAVIKQEALAARVYEIAL